MARKSGRKRQARIAIAAPVHVSLSLGPLPCPADVRCAQRRLFLRAAFAFEHALAGAHQPQRAAIPRVCASTGIEDRLEGRKRRPGTAELRISPLPLSPTVAGRTCDPFGTLRQRESTLYIRHIERACLCRQDNERPPVAAHRHDGRRIGRMDGRVTRPPESGRDDYQGIAAKADI